MFEFAPSVHELLRLQQRHTTQLNRAATTKEKLDAQFELLVKACKPVCISVVEVYNESKSPKIIPESIGLKIDLKNMTLAIAASLTFSNGREPDEELDTSDVEAIGAALAPLLEAEFKQQGIPFTFTRICVPPHYVTR